MAERRCLSKKITESDAFTDMPLSAQCLYFHLNMNADDDGFVNSPRKVQKSIGAKNSDLEILIDKSFLLLFESGIVVIKHWRMHNTIRKDRYNPTDYQEEFNQLTLKENNSYTRHPIDNHSATNWQPTGNHLAPQYNINKNNINKEKEIYKEKESKNMATKIKYGEFQNVLLTENEYHKLEKSNLLSYIDKLSSYIESKGKRYKSHYATILNWYRKDHPNSKPIPEWFDKEINNSGDMETDEEFKKFIEEFKKEGMKK